MCKNFGPHFSFEGVCIVANICNVSVNMVGTPCGCSPIICVSEKSSIFTFYLHDAKQGYYLP